MQKKRMPAIEQVSIVGGTVGIGTKTINDLLDNQIVVTLFARIPRRHPPYFPMEVIFLTYWRATLVA